MVDALNRSLDLMTPDGRLIDIHPKPEPPRLYILAGRTRQLAGWLQEEDDLVEYEQADQALEQAIAGGLWNLERRQLFEFSTYADSLLELQDYLQREWQDAFIDPRTAGQIEALWTKGSRLQLVESVGITRLGRAGVQRPGA
jgi:hypothetical protein